MNIEWVNWTLISTFECLPHMSEFGKNSGGCLTRAKQVSAAIAVLTLSLYFEQLPECVSDP
jgi:hypothetical protein